jgi:flagellar basal body-associated protein FliL
MIIDYAINNDSQKTRTITSIGIIAIVAAVALLGIVAITVVTIQQQQAEARPSTPVRSCDLGGGVYQSQGKCFNP